MIYTSEFRQELNGSMLKNLLVLEEHLKDTLSFAWSYVRSCVKSFLWKWVPFWEPTDTSTKDWSGNLKCVWHKVWSLPNSQWQEMTWSEDKVLIEDKNWIIYLQASSFNSYDFISTLNSIDANKNENFLLIYMQTTGIQYTTVKWFRMKLSLHKQTCDVTPKKPSKNWSWVYTQANIGPLKLWIYP